MQTDDTRALMNRYFEALASGDREGVLATLADDVEWQTPASAPIDGLTGAANIAQALGRDIVKQNFDTSKGFEIQVHSMIVEGGMAVVQQRVITTARSTGTPYDNEYCWVYRCENDRIVHMNEYVDTLYAAKAFAWEVN
ncbi:MAG: ketosteroid isomerase-like protein [Candidatus Poriferisodalaceae bacterium]|jgi:uncharacterized protein